MSVRSEQTSSLATGLIVISAVVVAGSSAYRTLAWRGQNPVGAQQQEAWYIDDWESFLPAGIHLGSDSAAVTILEFSDLSCPFARDFMAP
jgi:protein-disulfide isomerase